MRLFVGIAVDDQIKSRMLRIGERIDVRDVRVRWCTAEQLHLTLKFIGEVAEDQGTPICDAVRRVAEKLQPFPMQIANTGCFPGQGPVRIVWVGGSDPSGVLVEAVQGLEASLELLEIAREKRTFSEHFTIGRVKFDGSHGKLRAAIAASRFEPVCQNVSEIVLYQSILSGAGVQYSPILRAELKG